MLRAAEERQAPRGTPHDRVHRRDPPLQQGAAGRAAGPRRVGRHRADRRHHREPLVRGERGAPVALARRRAEAARGAGARAGAAPGADGSPSAASAASRPRCDEDALAFLAAAADGDARTALNVLELAVTTAPPDAEGKRPGRRGRHAGGVRAQGAALRQGRRGALQHHLGAAQVDPQLGRGRGALLARAHAGGRRGPAVRGAAAGALRLGGRGARRPAGAGGGDGRAAGRPLHRPAGGRPGARRARRVPGRGAEEQRALRGVRRGRQGRARDASRAGPAVDPQRPHRAHEGPGLRRGLPLRARRGGGGRRDGLPAREPAGQALLRTHASAAARRQVAARLEAARLIRERKTERPPRG